MVTQGVPEFVVGSDLGGVVFVWRDEGCEHTFTIPFETIDGFIAIVRECGVRARLLAGGQEPDDPIRVTVTLGQPGDS
jgi:hypothetical protein